MNPECSCRPEDSIKPDPYDYRTFTNCFGALEMAMGTCGDGEELHPITMECMEIPKPLSRCTDLGTFSNLNDCRWYYTCLWPPNSGGFQQVHIRCPYGQLFSSIHRLCIVPDGMPPYDLCEGVDFDALLSNLSLNHRNSFRNDQEGSGSGLVGANDNGDNQVGISNSVEYSASGNNLASERGTTTSSTTAAPVSASTNINVRAVPTLRSNLVFVTTTQSPSVTTTAGRTDSPRTYTCPLIVVLVIYWFPSVVDMACQVN